MTALSTGLDHADRVAVVGVVVPAHNEEHLLPRCLAALAHAADRIGGLRPSLAVRTVVVLDACTDRTVDVVSHHPGVDQVVIDSACVGAARAAGVAHLARHLDGPTQHIWLTTTDADSAVPADWLVEMVRLAESGLDAVIGTVEPDPSDLPADIVSRWRQQHQLVHGHRHVHAANLGLRLSAYAAAGGFEPVVVHEDARLVDQLLHSGARILATADLPVVTSGRIVGRAPGGFAAYLNALVNGSPVVDPI